MIMPIGVDHGLFYRAAKAKNIRVSSRFRGVHIQSDRGNTTISWAAKYQGGKKTVVIGRFPLTAEGEEQARVAYERYLEENNITERYSKKRIMKPKKTKNK